MQAAARSIHAEGEYQDEQMSQQRKQRLKSGEEFHSSHHPRELRIVGRAAYGRLGVVAGLDTFNNVRTRLTGWVIIRNLRPVKFWSHDTKKLYAWSWNASNAPLRHCGVAALTEFGDGVGSSEAINDQVSDKVVFFRHATNLSTLKPKGKALLNEMCLS